MSDSGTATPDAAAVRAALLTYYEDRRRPLAHALVTAARLYRLKLAWAAQVLVAGSVFRTGQRLERGEVPHSVHMVTRRYAELSGKDAATARQDVDRMAEQLELFPLPELVRLAPDPPIRPLTRAELEAIADTLLTLALAGWPSDDPLLADTQSCYAALVELRDAEADRLAAPGLRGLRAAIGEATANAPRHTETRQHCHDAWIRWLDQQPRR